MEMEKLVHLHRWRAVSLRRFLNTVKICLYADCVWPVLTTHTSIANPNHVAAGAQDQGYQRTETELSEEGRTALFNTSLGTTHGTLPPTAATTSLVAVSRFTLIHVGEDNPALYYADFPQANERLGCSLVADPTNGEQAYLERQTVPL